MMNLDTLLKITAIGMCALAATPGHGQYDTLFVGDPEALSSGPFETPFPTSLAGTSRTQYLVYSQELAGLLPPGINIDGLVIGLVTGDPPGTTVDLEMRLKNTTSTNMGSLDLAGLNHNADTSDLYLDTGVLAIYFDLSPFQWTGAPFNILVEFAVHRYGPPGADPQVKLDTSFVPMPTYYMQDSAIISFNDFLFSAQYQASFDSRPVMGFLVESSTSVSAYNGSAVHVAIYPNPAQDRLRLQVLNATNNISAKIFSSTGAIVQDASALRMDAQGFVDVPIAQFATGCYLIHLLGAEGELLWAQQFMVE